MLAAKLQPDGDQAFLNSILGGTAKSRRTEYRVANSMGNTAVHGGKLVEFFVPREVFTFGVCLLAGDTEFGQLCFVCRFVRSHWIVPRQIDTELGVCVALANQLRC